MKIKAVRCKLCGDVIYSRATHDCRFCTCEETAVDGGFNYLKVSGDMWEVVDVEVGATKQELYDDWNKSIDKFGKIKGKGFTLPTEV
jgi:hypothetical protein